MLSSRQRFWDQLRALGFDTYAAYLQSPHWQELRRRYFASKLFKGQCYSCGGPGPFQLHHRTYRRLGREWLQDLVAVCDLCHGFTHALESKAHLGLWKATRKARAPRSVRGQRRRRAHRPLAGTVRVVGREVVG
jgi:5-methylcytosine-specific restriction endonuclease McrA